MSTWWKDYQKFLRSDEWKLFRQQAFKKYGRKCYCCGCVVKLQIHHLSYKGYNRGRMDLNEVVPLCSYCHKELTKAGPKVHLKGKSLLAWHIKSCIRRETYKKGPRRA